MPVIRVSPELWKQITEVSGRKGVSLSYALDYLVDHLREQAHKPPKVVTKEVPKEVVKIKEVPKEVVKEVPAKCPPCPTVLTKAAAYGALRGSGLRGQRTLVDRLYELGLRLCKP